MACMARWIGNDTYFAVKLKDQLKIMQLRTFSREEGRKAKQAKVAGLGTLSHIAAWPEPSPQLPEWFADRVGLYCVVINRIQRKERSFCRKLFW